MKFGELVDLCIRMIENFDPKKAVSSYVDDFLKGVTNPHENVFIKQVFYGVIRYKSFLKVDCVPHYLDIHGGLVQGEQFQHQPWGRNSLLGLCLFDPLSARRAQPR